MANWKLPELNVGINYITITYYNWRIVHCHVWLPEGTICSDSSPSGTHKKHHALSPGFGVEEFQQPLGNLYMEYSFGAWSWDICRIGMCALQHQQHVVQLYLQHSYRDVLTKGLAQGIWKNWFSIYLCSAMHLRGRTPFVHHSLTGWWFGAFFIFHFICGMSSFPLTNSIIFQRGWNQTTNQI
jgi:hypothetical protein